MDTLRLKGPSAIITLHVTADECASTWVGVISDNPAKRIKTVNNTALVSSGSSCTVVGIVAKRLEKVKDLTTQPSKGWFIMIAMWSFIRGKCLRHWLGKSPLDSLGWTS